MKLNKLCLTVAAALAASAVGNVSAATTTVHLSSATALRDTMVRMVTQYCDTTKPMRITERTTTKSGTTPFPNGQTSDLTSSGDKDFRHYECTFQTGGPVPAGHVLSGQTLSIFHTVKVNSALGGSIVGVMPIYRDIEMEFVVPPTQPAQVIGAVSNLPAFNAADPNQLCIANSSELIAGVSWPKAKCRSAKGVRPDVGVSDTEPSSFVGLNSANPATVLMSSTTPALDEAPEPSRWTTDITIGDTNLGTSAPFVIVGFGIAVTNDLYNAVKPIKNLSKTQLASILSGNVDNWSEVGGPNMPVKICRRTQGSGTQASWNAMANNYPCKSNSAPFGALTIADAGTVGAHEGVILGHDLTVSESAATSGVKTCLTSSTNAIGIMSLENNELNSSKNWQFVALDGVQPFDESETIASPDNVADRIREEHLTSGNYNYIQEPTIQWLNSLADVGTNFKLSFGELLRDQAGHPDITKNLPGIVSLPNFTFAASPSLSCDDPTTGVSSVSKVGNSCQTATRASVCGL